MMGINWRAAILLASLATNISADADTDVESEREPLMLGRCYSVGHCALEGGQRLVEESEAVYARERVGEWPEACFLRGRHRWQACRNTLYQPVYMIFDRQGRGESPNASFPPLRVAQEALAAAHQPLMLEDGFPCVEQRPPPDSHDFILDHMDEFDEFLSENPRDGQVFMRERLREARAPRIHGEEPGGWKTLHIFVGRTGFDEDIIHEFNSQKGQDQLVLQILGYKRGGFFIELGAFDAIGGSNSLSLERNYGWNGLCIEPKEEHQWALAHRRCTLISAVVGRETDDIVTFNMRGWCGSGCAGIVGEGTQNTEKGHSFRHLPVVTFAKLLHDFRVPEHIDYL